MKRYILSDAAQADIDGIWNYTALTWSVDKAEQYVGDIRLSLDAIVAGSKTGRSAESVKAGHLKLRVGSRFIFFRIDVEIVYVVRVLHERMDFPFHLS